MTLITIPPGAGTGSKAASTFASQPSFSQKLLNFAVTLDPTANSQPNSFAELNGLPSSGTFNLSGYRARCRISLAGAPGGGDADISIYGLSPSLMNQLATLGVVVDSVSKNSVIVSAGAASNSDASSANAGNLPPQGLQVVFAGTIWFAYGDYNNMPDVPFRMTARSGLINAVQSVAPASFSNKSASIVSIMQNFADQLGVPLENNGVTATLANPYFPGTLLQQIYQAAYHAGIRALLVDGGTKLAIMPLYGSRTSQANIPLVSPNTGMVGYPSFAQNGYLVVKMVYNPDVIFLGNIQIESSIPQANKTWTVYKLELALDTLLPDGEWMATAFCYPQGVNAPVPPSVTP